MIRKYLDEQGVHCITTNPNHAITVPQIYQVPAPQNYGHTSETLRIRLYGLRKGLTLQSYCGDGIGTIKPTRIGRTLDS